MTPRDLFHRLRSMAETHGIPRDWLHCDLVGDVGGLREGDVVGVVPAAGCTWATGVPRSVEQYRNSTVKAIVVYGWRVAILPRVVEDALYDGVATLDTARLARCGITEIDNTAREGKEMKPMERAHHRCECPYEGSAAAVSSSWYDPVTELPYVEHKPGECRCTNKLQRYRRGNKLMWLCSCCTLPGDIENGSGYGSGSGRRKIAGNN